MTGGEILAGAVGKTAEVLAGGIRKTISPYDITSLDNPGLSNVSASRIKFKTLAESSEDVEWAKRHDDDRKGGDDDMDMLDDNNIGEEDNDDNTSLEEDNTSLGENIENHHDQDEMLGKGHRKRQPDIVIPMNSSNLNTRM
ncbi:hypothetical protein L6452_15184 [Arctium lappa]|uniref:Uncharacterized protein n=1 Tax=Arctium lappa TaxID=4217 RepID=A0ACB9CN28_ARCLA|nr:hypothetical protein L6452_15184 [Arctium lappa]